MGKDKTITDTQALHIADVRQRCLKVVNDVCTETDIDEQVRGWIDDLDFVEIVMSAELEFDCKIEEGETRVDDFEKVNDLINWMVTNVA